MLNAAEIIESHFPNVAKRPKVAALAQKMIKRLIHEDRINQFVKNNADVRGCEYLERVLEELNVDFVTSHNQRENIPVSGKVIIVANHPIGSLDGLALLQMVRAVRPDVKVVVNQLLTLIEPLNDWFLPVNNLNGRTQKSQFEDIYKALNNEEAVIVFPAGEVSRLGLTGVKDGPWRTSFLKWANKTGSPILPVHVGGHNSAKFYGASIMYRPLGGMLLVDEMFRNKPTSLKFTVGQVISQKALNAMDGSLNDKAATLRKHLYSLVKNKFKLGKETISTEPPIALPESRKELLDELKSSTYLGKTCDNKHVYLYHYRENSSVLREIGRLREVAFRAVGEGTGKRRDTDEFDAHYSHLVLWDDGDLEIAGSYRVANSQRVIEQFGKQGLYCSSLFNLSEQMNQYLASGLELGRSFVQPKYWGKRTLDSLWQAIGLYLNQNPDIRYLFGPVSISDDYPKRAKDLLVSFYQCHFGSSETIATSFNQYQLDQVAKEDFNQLFSGDDYKADFRALKQELGKLGCNVPTLYKQYTELCGKGGVQFLDFGVDADFGDCIDGLVLVDITTLTEKKRQRYLQAA